VVPQVENLRYEDGGGAMQQVGNLRCGGAGVVPQVENLRYGGGGGGRTQVGNLRYGGAAAVSRAG